MIGRLRKIKGGQIKGVYENILVNDGIFCYGYIEFELRIFIKKGLRVVEMLEVIFMEIVFEVIWMKLEQQLVLFVYCWVKSNQYNFWCILSIY